MRKLCPSGYVARINRRQNTGHIPGKKSAANKRVYTVSIFSDNMRYERMQ